MRRQMEHRKEGIFVAEGEKVVRRLLESDFGVVSLLMPEKWLAQLDPLLESRPETVQVYLAEKTLLETLTGFSMYQGLLAVGRVPAQPSLDQILGRSSRPLLLVALDGLTNAENLGALVRNCAAFGVHALITGETCTSPFVRRAVRSSMGTIFQLAVIELASIYDSGLIRAFAAASTREDYASHTSDPRSQGATPATLVETLRLLRSQDIHCIAAHPHAAAKNLRDGNFKSDCCILFGSEGYGISQSLLDCCDAAVAIPMAPKIDSLNVAAAAAVFLYEAQRQRAP